MSESLPPELLSQIFPLNAEEMGRAALTPDFKLAYYTTADTAFKIIRSGEIWMRSVHVMNDLHEGRHGYDCIRNALGLESGIRFRELVCGLVPGAEESIFDRFRRTADQLPDRTFLACFCHHGLLEASAGRLSMWRAYGGNSGTALLLDPAHLDRILTSLGLSRIPVVYGGITETGRIFRGVSESLAESFDMLRKLDPTTLALHIRAWMLLFAVSLKHTAFREEREWRVVAAPSVFGTTKLPGEPVVVSDVAQLVLKLPLQISAIDGEQKTLLSNTLSQILVGPCMYPEVVKAGFASCLRAAGFTECREKVVISGIPLRLS